MKIILPDFLNIFCILKIKDEMWLVVLCDGRPVAQTNKQYSEWTLSIQALQMVLPVKISWSADGQDRGQSLHSMVNKLNTFCDLKWGLTISKKEMTFVCTKLKVNLLHLDTGSNTVYVHACIHTYKSFNFNFMLCGV